MSSILKVCNLSVRFDRLSVLSDLSFEVEKGTITSIIGPNGAGKTVLFRALLGLVPSEGVVEWEPNVKIGYVPQKLSIDKTLPINVMDFLKFKSHSREEIFEALEAVGFLHHKDTGQHHDITNAKLGHLSGGELQRVLIAYALIGHPNVLLFDEPTSGVDIGGEETIYSVLEKLREKHGLTILLISHDINVVYRYSSKVLCINREKVCYGPPKEVLAQGNLEQLYGAKVGIYHHGH